jgi:Ca2+-binding EF-hand superfamily protein
VHGNGKISKKNLRAGLATLEIGIKYDEINDLMRLVDADKDGFISYDEFITRLDANIVHRRQSLLHLIEDKVLTKIEAVLNHTGGDHPLYQAMAVYDLENEGQIEARDLIRVFKRLGL